MDDCSVGSWRRPPYTEVSGWLLLYVCYQTRNPISGKDLQFGGQKINDFSLWMLSEKIFVPRMVKIDHSIDFCMGWAQTNDVR